MPSSRPKVEWLFTGGLLIAIAAYVAVYLSAIGPYWNISPDSAAYITRARLIAEGRGLGEPSVHPPVTSIVFALVLQFAPDGYTALNAATTLLFLAALAMAFRLLSPDAGRNRALAAVLATLAFDRFILESTNLLSEPVYMAVSVFALLMMEAPRRPESAVRLSFGHGVAAAAIVTAVLTRTVGIALGAAAVLVELRARLGRQRPVRPLLLAGGILALGIFIAREVMLVIGGRTGAVPHWITARAIGPDAPSGTLASLREVADHLRAEIGSATATGGVLMGGASTGSSTVDAILMAGGTALVITGLVAALRNGVRVLPVYVLLYLLIVVVHVVRGGFGPGYRHLVVVAPFLFHYAAEGVLACAAPIATRVPRLRLRRILSVAGVLYIAALAYNGWDGARWLARDQHRSPFGAYPIRRPQNYDVQRLAMRLGSLARPEDVYAGVQIEMHDVLTGRTGHDLLDVPADSPDALAEWLRRLRVRWVLLDLTIPGAVDRVRGYAERYPSSLRMVEQLTGAALYERLPP